MNPAAMKSRDIHDVSDFFEYVRLGDSVPPADAKTIDVALLDMNHSWPNVGHDSIVHSVLEAAEALQPKLAAAGRRVRVLSFDVRRRMLLPDAPNGRYAIYLGTGGPGHLDPRQNDGLSEFSQGIDESDAWEAPLFRLFDRILAHPSAALLGICHSFGLICRWSGIARAELRGPRKGGKSSGMPMNLLSWEAVEHPYFSRFAAELPDHRHYRVVDNRLFDLVANRPDGYTPLGYENEQADTLTMVELARRGGMPRILAMNHHPEIIDREHLLTVLEEKRAHGEVSEQWFQERSHTLENEMRGEAENQSRLTSDYTFLTPLRWHLEQLI
jgi:hypothetical protein